MSKYKQKLMQHLGIVAGICNEIGLIESIDEYIDKPKRKVTVGQSVQSMVLNALGFTGRAMYLNPEFYNNRPVELLIGENITAEDLNENCLGSALDALYDCGLTELFYSIASKALKTYRIPHNFVHLDSTTFSLYGKYNQEDKDSDMEIVKITKGYSKDGHPELNQVVVGLMTAHRSSIPIWIETLSGNINDKRSFPEIIKKYKQQFRKKNLPYFVADSVLFTKESLEQLAEIQWVTRVPETIKAAKETIIKTDKTEMITSSSDGYYYKEIQQEYAGIQQRWLIVFSQAAYTKEYATLTKNIQKENQKKGKEAWHLENRAFACEADAIKAAKVFDKKLKYHNLKYKTTIKNLHDKKGRPGKDQKPVSREWYLDCVLEINPESVSEARKRKGFFIIATNELDKNKITSEQLLSVYKAQGISVERGFRFLKDPMFYAESLYLKLPERIMALIMVMGLSLLIYSLAERKLRKALKENKRTIGNQKRKPTDNPTIRWVFQKFEGVLLLYIYENDSLKEVIAELNQDHETVIRSLGSHVEKMYFFEF